MHDSFDDFGYENASSRDEVSARKNVVCVFASAVVEPSVEEVRWVSKFSAHVGRANARVIYGGGPGGFMGAVAKACLKSDTEVVGYRTPQIAAAEDRLDGVQYRDDYSDIAARKVAFATDADAFVVFPGGIGTLDEVFSVLEVEWRRPIPRPIVFANPDRVWDGLFETIEGLSGAGYIDSSRLDMVMKCDSLDAFVSDLSRSVNQQVA